MIDRQSARLNELATRVDRAIPHDESGNVIAGATAERAPCAAVPPCDVVSRSARGGGKGAADVEIGAERGDRQNWQIKAGAERAPCAAIPAGEL